jgi:hypothetical protein
MYLVVKKIYIYIDIEEAVKIDGINELVVFYLEVKKQCPILICIILVWKPKDLSLLLSGKLNRMIWCTRYTTSFLRVLRENTVC